MAMNVEQFAMELELPIELLLEQLQAAGVAKKLEGDTVSEQEKSQMLEHLRSAHGSSKNKITLVRSEKTAIKKTDSTGKSRTIQVEVRKKRTLDPTAPVVASFTAQTIVNQAYVIDGMNICGWYRKTHPKDAPIQPLLTVLIALLDNGYDS